MWWRAVPVAAIWCAVAVVAVFVPEHVVAVAVIAVFATAAASQ